VITFASIVEDGGLAARRRIDDIWDLLAYVGRYGHQNAEFFMARPLQSLTKFADALGRRLEKEDVLARVAEDR
jgi:hypothetical protein